MSILKFFAIGSLGGGTPSEKLPADVVLFWNKSLDPLPDGFSYLEGYDNLLIMGASSLAENLTTGGTAADLSVISGATVPNGAHGVLPHNAFSLSGNGGQNWPKFNAFPGGGHSHVCTRNPNTSLPIPTNMRPPGRSINMITNSTEVSSIPKNTVFFTVGVVKANYTRVNWSGVSAGVYSVRTSIGIPNPSTGTTFPVTFTFQPGGQHTHPSPILTFNPSPSPTTPRTVSPRISPGAVTTHTHPDVSANFKLFQPFKHMNPYTSTSDITVDSGIIVMYKGTSAIPQGWKLCDGTNGTPDLRNHFIGYDNAETNNNVSKSDKKFDAIAPTHTTPDSSYPLTQRPAPSPNVYYFEGSFIPLPVATVPWPHDHSVSNFTPTTQVGQEGQHASRTAPHNHILQIASQPVTSTVGFQIPTNFVPAHVKLCFIQKD